MEADLKTPRAARRDVMPRQYYLELHEEFGSEEPTT